MSYLRKCIWSNTILLFKWCLFLSSVNSANHNRVAKDLNLQKKFEGLRGSQQKTPTRRDLVLRNV